MNPLRTFSGAFRSRINIILALVLGLTGGVVMDRLAMGTLSPFASSINFGLIAEAWNAIDRAYVDRTVVNPHTLTYGAISGMVDSLDDTGHSRFLSPDMVKDVRQIEQRRFEGIGAELRMKDGHVVIASPMPGSPALRAGLRPNDVIVKVDGVSVVDQSLDEVVKRIAGRAGTQVTLSIMDPISGATRDVKLTRARITIHEVAWHQLPGTALAHLHIASFNKGVSGDLRKALAAIKREHLQGLILDLRNNPGGLLDEAVNTASQFLQGGDVLLVRNAVGEVKPIPARSGGVATQIPMVLLVNGGSASASEIVAGALQDANRATIIGEATFGTGTVLNEFDLSDGSALLLAVEEWLTPKGHLIWHKGITPGIEVPLPANAVPLFPGDEEDMAADQLRRSDDKQLLRALDFLPSRPDLAGKGQ